MKVGNPSEIVNGIWAIEKAYADANLFKAIQILKGHEQNAVLISQENAEPKCSINDKALRWEQYQWREFDEVPENSILAIDVYGVVTKYNQYSGAMGMQALADIVKRGNSNQNISSILLYINSGGGEGYAAMEMVNALQNISKPTIAFIDDLAASAAYWIAAACDYVVANSEMAQVGSIGTYVTVADYRQALENEGIKLTEVYAEKSSDKNRDYKEAIDGNTELLQEKVNRFNENFLNSVKAFRGEKLTSDDWQTGKVYFATEAKQLGLIDDIGSFEEVLKSLKS